jgi:acetyl-CoA acetyltransferase family protein
MREAVIVSTARTGIARAFKGSLNHTRSPSLLGHVMAHALQRAQVDGAEVEDAVAGTVLAAGTAGMNVARHAVLAAGLPCTVAAQTMDRQCASGLMAIATAAKQVMVDGMDIVLAGGQENISAVQKPYFEAVAAARDPRVEAHAPHAYMPMLETAEWVARRHGITREAQDRYALESQRRTAQAQADGLFDEEIVPLRTTMLRTDPATGASWREEVELTRDEGNRPGTTYDSLAVLRPVLPDGRVTAGNASQLSDGASACVVMEARMAERRGLRPLGIYRGMAVAGCRPEEMGIGPLFAVPKLLRQHGLRVADVGLWEAERGLRLPGAVLPRPTGHRSGPVQRERRRHRHRPSLRHDGCPPGGACAAGGPPPARTARGGDNVRGRRHGRGRPLRHRLKDIA